MKKISFIMAIMLFIGLFGGCNSGGSTIVTVDNSVKTKKYTLNEIAYVQSETEKTIDDTYLTVNVPARDSIPTGETIAVSSRIKANKFWTRQQGAIVAGAVYYVVDWGDGTWSYNGPGVQSDSLKSTITNYHAYKKPGVYYISAAAFCMQTDEMVGWSDGKRVVITGEEIEYEGMIDNLLPISSKENDKNHKVEAIVDGSGDTYFRSQAAEDAYDEQYAGFLFDDNYTLNMLEVQIPTDADIFPSNIAVEYTTDYGESWHALPKYYYLNEYAEGIFNPIMRFPNPKGATLVLPMDDIVANGIRLVSKLTSISFADINKEKYLAVAEMRVYGDRRTLFYTSLGNTFDADLNNMWTIYGTAKTEPNLVGALTSYTNQSPFRTGQAIIGSTEWLEWTGLKFNWTDYDEARDTVFNFLKSSRTGPDGWSNDSRYIWATGTGQYHLDMGAHYTYNSIFILAARNYLMQGNNLGEVAADGTVTPFMDMTNTHGQTMRKRLDDAMGYMLETLDGSSGVMVIKDPRNQGLAGAAKSVSSNYWDALTACGYMSAYENVFFYGSVLAYADILAYMGEDNTQYLELAELIKQKFNETFWDRNKKRYITSINANGVKLDFGLTFVNFMAVAYGLADDIQTAAIYSWLDGERIIEGDTSTGEDIYGKFKYAARSNTLDVSKVTDESNNWYWWYNEETMSPAAGLGAYGNQMQNGGTIFYISYYDLLGRYTMDADNAFDRFKVIMDEFHKDQLRRNARTYFGEYVEGILGEFPESGLVPYTFVNRMVGINATVRGLEISSNLPSEMQYAGVSTYCYGNRTYSIRVDKTVQAPKVEKFDDGSFFVTLPADGTWIITADNRLIQG